jgi:hypothetical protein
MNIIKKKGNKDEIKWQWCKQETVQSVINRVACPEYMNTVNRSSWL